MCTVRDATRENFVFLRGKNVQADGEKEAGREKKARTGGKKENLLRNQLPISSALLAPCRLQRHSLSTMSIYVVRGTIIRRAAQQQTEEPSEAQQ